MFFFLVCMFVHTMGQNINPVKLLSGDLEIVWLKYSTVVGNQGILSWWNIIMKPVQGKLIIYQSS